MALLFRLLSHLPLRVLHALGAFVGMQFFALSTRDRRRMEVNLAGAGLSTQVSPLHVMIEAGQGLFELPWLWLRPQAEVVAKVTAVTGWDLVEQAWQREKGILFLTPHLGCFEITAQYYASFKPMTVLYRRPKQAWLQPIVELGRGNNLRLAAADMSGVRALLRALRAGEAVGMLPDQVPGNGEGVWVPFFGRPAYTMTLAARLAATGATPLLAYAERLPRGKGYHLKLFPFPTPLDGSLEGNAAAINAALETLIRQCPQQYAWNYNRYKVPSGATPP
jgi:KDO2-lipid IV(A) lauroyltransferase